MAYLNGKFTCFDPQISITDDTLAMVMNNNMPDVFYSRAQKITSRALEIRSSSAAIHLPECTYLETEAIILRYCPAARLILPKIQRIEDGGLQTLIGDPQFLMFGSEGNGLVWANIDPEMGLTANCHFYGMIVFVDETQEDYLDFVDYLLDMADIIEIFDSEGNRIEVL